MTTEGRAKRSCYAHAASSAYPNTIARIFGYPDPPSFTDVFRITDYSRGACGQPAKFIQRLESHYGRGVLCGKLPLMQLLRIRDIIVISAIVSFTTSKAGWRAIAVGSLLEKLSGDPDRWYATSIEGYDLHGGSEICKNS
jgi:hypothetical protein